MRKIFLFFAAMLVALTVSATTHEIGSGTSNILGTTVAAAADGDVIVLTDNGPYVNVSGNDYTKLQKNLTIQAAEGKTPVVKYEVPFRSAGGKTVKFIGITFDGTSLTGYDFYFRFYDANDNLEFEDCEFLNISKYVFQVYSAKSANSLKLTNCKLHDNSSRGILNQGTLTSLEINGGQIYNFTGYPVLDNYEGATLGKVKINGTEFYGNTKDIISGVATSHADSCIINNCYFHNNSRSAVYFPSSSVEGKETCDGVIVKNSTFANNDLSASSRSVIDVCNYGTTEAATIEVTVDHCTFYNNTTVNYDYSCVRSKKSTKVNITNSIFAYPSAIEFYATNCYGGTISNTLVYNLNKGHRSSSSKPAVSNTNTADPLFTDAANGDFSFAGNRSTGSISPARGAATDGSDLGDPRWYTDEVVPNADWSSPYFLEGTIAQLNGNIYYSETDSLHYEDKSECGTAIWKINALVGGVIEATANYKTGSASGAQLQMVIFDKDGNQVGDTLKQGYYQHDGDVAIGTIILPSAGVYTIKLLNAEPWSSAKLKGVTLMKTADAKTLYCYVDKSWWTGGSAKVNCYAKVNGGVEYAAWPGVPMDEVEENLWKVVIPSTYDRLNFTRTNPAQSEYWGAKTDEMDIPTSMDYYTITSDDEQWDSQGHTAAGTWSKKDAKFYVAGSMTSWGDDKIGSLEDSYTLSLAAGTYQLKAVDLSGNWYGIADMTDVAGGLYIDQDGNVCFVLAAAGDVTVNYKSGELFTLEGDFVAPEVKLIGSNELGAWHAEDAVALTPASDKKTAAVTIKLANEWYDFKVIRNGEWLGKVNEGDGNYRIHSEFTTVDGLVRDYEGLKSISLQPSVVNKDYTFTWTYATGQLAVTFPSSGTALDNTAVADKAQKFMENGQLFIRRDGKIYTTTGVQVK